MFRPARQNVLIPSGPGALREAGVYVSIPSGEARPRAGQHRDQDQMSERGAFFDLTSSRSVAYETVIAPRDRVEIPADAPLAMPVQPLSFWQGGARAAVDMHADMSLRRWVVFLAPAVLGLAGLLIALPVVVSASDIFSDVPDSSTFHDNINALYGARVTTGCAAGKYCPNDPVTRGAIAAFPNRSAGPALMDTMARDFASGVLSSTIT